MTPSTPAQKALAALRQMLAGRTGYAAADWALTLHMLEHLAPGFFAAEGLGAELEAALEALGAMPVDLPAALDQHEAMARVDAVYLRSIRGLPAKPLDASKWVVANATEHPLHAWFIAAVAGLPPPFASRYPFKTSSPLSQLYMLTHEVMLDTRFFSEPLKLADAPRILDELGAALPSLIADREWDLVAEIAFTLRFAGRDCGSAIESLIGLDCADGSSGATAPQELSHAAATHVLALAAISDPESPRPSDPQTLRPSDSESLSAQSDQRVRITPVPGYFL